MQLLCRLGVDRGAGPERNALPRHDGVLNLGAGSGFTFPVGREGDDHQPTCLLTLGYIFILLIL